MKKKEFICPVHGHKIDNPGCINCAKEYTESSGLMRFFKELAKKLIRERKKNV